VMLRCSGDLYTFPAASHQAYAASSDVALLWHGRLGHPSPAVFTRLQRLVPSNKCLTSICHACQLGKHVRLLVVPLHVPWLHLNYCTVMFGHLLFLVFPAILITWLY
jgi:hypothetical protein